MSKIKLESDEEYDLLSIGALVARKNKDKIVVYTKAVDEERRGDNPTDIYLKIYDSIKKLKKDMNNIQIDYEREVEEADEEDEREISFEYHSGKNLNDGYADYHNCIKVKYHGYLEMSVTMTIFNISKMDFNKLREKYKIKAINKKPDPRGLKKPAKIKNKNKN